MIDFIFHHYYFLCMLALVVLFSCIAYDEGWDRIKEKADKSNAILITALILSGPLGAFAILCVVFYHELQDRIRKDCGMALSRWEKKARLHADESLQSWGWYNEPKNKEVRYEALRSCVNSLSDRELNLLLSVAEETFKIERELKDALVDELLHRKIANHE